MFGKKKEKAKKKDSLEEISSNEVEIRVYSEFGGNVRHLKAQFNASEKRDEYNNLIIENKKSNFNEDTDFSIEDVYSAMEVQFRFKNLDQKGRVELLERMIKFQERKVSWLNRHVLLNAHFNCADEEAKLNHLKVMREHVLLHDQRGSYFTIENGKRVYHFSVKDSVLVPIWHGVNNFSSFPDQTRKKKIHIQEDQIFRQEMQLYNKEKKIGNALTVALVIVSILIIVNLFAGYKLYDKHSEMEERILGSAFQCAEYTSALNKNFAQLMDQTVIKALLEREISEVEPTDNRTGAVDRILDLVN